MHEQQRQRAARLLDESGIEWALFSDIDSVRWLTGLDLPAPALVWFDRGSFTLLVDEGYAVVAAAFGDNSNCAHVSYVGYTIQQPIDAPGRLAEALNELVGGSGTTAAPVGIEEKSLLWALWQTLQKALPGCEPASLEGKLVPLRAVKTEEELARTVRAFVWLRLATTQAARPSDWGSARSTFGPRCRLWWSGRRASGCRWAMIALSAIGQPISAPRRLTMKSSPMIPSFLI